MSDITKKIKEAGGGGGGGGGGGVRLTLIEEKWRC